MPSSHLTVPPCFLHNSVCRCQPFAWTWCDSPPYNPTCLEGAKILLNNAVLNLKRGKRYGLCGPNGCGKSTLMRSIANGQVKEFPPQDELKTVYVEHDIDAEETQQSVMNYVLSDSQLVGEHALLLCRR